MQHARAGRKVRQQLLQQEERRVYVELEEVAPLLLPRARRLRDEDRAGVLHDPVEAAARGGDGVRDGGAPCLGRHVGREHLDASWRAQRLRLEQQLLAPRDGEHGGAAAAQAHGDRAPDPGRGARN
jgi:hypothetical protein